MKDYKNLVVDNVEKNSKELIELSQYIYNNPETCFKEYKACEVLVNYAREKGFEVEEHVGGLDTAFKATYNSGKEGIHIALLSEYDALEGLGHACGHNIMAAMGIGSAVAVKEVIDEIGGSVSVIGTPAEEGGGGKIILLENGVFKDVDVSMILHPASDTVVNDISYSRTDLQVNFYGKRSHAATFPYEGVSALNAIIQLFNIINGMKLELMERGKILGVITKGGDDPVMIPEHCQAKFTIRSFEMKFKKELLNRFLEICEHVAKITNTTFEYKWIDRSYEDIRNNPTIEGLLENNFTTLGETVKPRERELGIGCTDMGNITHEIPGLQSYIKVQEGLRGHTVEFLEACGDERGERALLVGTKALAMTSIDLLKSKENMEKVINDFKEMKAKYE